LWPNTLVPGELSQLLPSPRHFEQASSMVSEDMIRSKVPCGPDPRRHLDALGEYVSAGYDEVYVQQIGPDQDAFFRGWAEHVLPAARRQLVNA
jgi:hypothetical protein